MQDSATGITAAVSGVSSAAESAPTPKPRAHKHSLTHKTEYALARILENLLSNAIKFSKPFSSVMVNYGHGPTDFFVSVKDTGPGFSEADKSLMYQKFKRLSAQPTASESSNGLGLALIKYSVERLGGTIELISEERKGSEFIVRFPL